MSDKPKIYYIADPHFGHRNIINLCGRPFDSVEEMYEELLHNWKRVRPQDYVYIVGDLAYRMPEDKVINLARSLPGRKILLCGNHDSLKYNPKFRVCFERIEDLMEIDDNGRKVVLCHYPIVEWNGYFRGAYLVFGHIHNNTKNPSYKHMFIEDRALNAGVEINGYGPVTLDELIENNAKFKADNPIT